MPQEFDIKQEPLLWRLDRKAGLAADELSPAMLLEMSREGIRAIRTHVPVLEKMRIYGGAERYYVAVHEIEELEQARIRLKSDAPGTHTYEDVLDHVVDVESLMSRTSKAMERFNEDFKEYREPQAGAPAARGCLVAGLLLGSGFTTAMILVRFLA